MKFEEHIRHELKMAYDKDILENITGPLIFGAGNFEVYLENDAWEIRPINGWKPAELRGIINNKE